MSPVKIELFCSNVKVAFYSSLARGGEVGGDGLLTPFSLGVFGLQCLHLLTAHPQGPITVQLPTTPHLPLPTPPRLLLPTPLPQHKPIPPHQPQAITLHPQWPIVGALQSLPAGPHG